MVQNDELKQTIHRYRGVVMNAVKIFLIFSLTFSFRSLIHYQRLIFVKFNFQEMTITFKKIPQGSHAVKF